MKIVNVTSRDLEDFKDGGKFNRIIDLYNEIVKEIPENIVIELKYRKLKLDYCTEDLDLPKFTIPYCFDINDFTPELAEYFKKYIIYVEW